MLKSYFVILFAIVIDRGYSQVALKFFNQSSATIDSIVIKSNKRFNIGSIGKNEKATFFIGASQADFHSFAPFYIYIYSQVLTTKVQYYRTGFIDSIYFFDHGLSKLNKEPERPEKFYLDITNISAEKVDTVFTINRAITHIIEYSPRRVLVYFDHKQLESEQSISVKLRDKILSATLKDLNINDWNVQRGTLYVTKDSIIVAFTDKHITPFEFIIDINLDESTSFNDIKIEAKHLLKTYNNTEDNRLRAVFDYSAFISNPRFEIKIKRKSHSIKLLRRDLEATQYIDFSIRKGNIVL
jgi:hypothetical protein